MLQNLMRKMKKDDKGFTLVELMIVVVIIGILIAIAIPVYNNIEANARLRSCEANQRTIQSQMEVYKAATAAEKAALYGDAVDSDAELALFLANITYFATPPTCTSTGGGYSLASGVVVCAVHN